MTGSRTDVVLTTRRNGVAPRCVCSPDDLLFGAPEETEESGLLHLEYSGPSKTSVSVHPTMRRRSVRLHTHEYFEIAFVESGRAIHHFGASSYEVQPGDILVISPSIPHGYTLRPGDRTTIVNVNFYLESVGDALKDTLVTSFMAALLSGALYERAGRPGLFRSLPRRVTGRIREMNEEFLTGAPGWETVLNSLLRIVLVELQRRSAPTARAETPRRDAPIANTILRIIPEIHRTASANVSVAALASMAGLSPGYFGRQFKKVMGRSVTHYVQRVRVLEAIELLCTTERTVEDISGEVGYQDTGTFRSVFKRVTGSPPSEYRAKNSRPHT